MGKFSEAATATQEKRCKMGEITDGFDADDLDSYTSLAKARKFAVIRSAVDNTVSMHAVTAHAKGICGCVGTNIAGHGVII